MNVVDESKHGLGFMRWDMCLLLKGFWGPLRGWGRKRGTVVICGVVLVLCNSSVYILFKKYLSSLIYLVLCPYTKIRLIR